MKQTPMQELLEWVRTTLPMDLETPQMIEQKIKSMLDKEKNLIADAWEDGASMMNTIIDGDEYYNETFNTNEK
jgi:hypothetical protein